MKDNFFVKNKSIITFLILEIVALTAFNFGNISYIFGIAGAVLAVVSFLFVVGINWRNNYLWILLPVGILLVISIFGSFNKYGTMFGESVGKISNISLLVSLPSFLLLGFAVRKMNDVKPKTVLFVVGGGLAAVTLFGFFSTLILYGPFYSLIYKNTPNYYYHGMPYDVTKEMFWLSGFEFTEVYIEYGSLFALLCGSFLPGLLFISPKKERNDFIICALIGGIGVLTLLLIPNFKALILLVLTSSVAFIIKYLKKHQLVKNIIAISFACIVLLGLVFFDLTLINAANGFKFSGTLERVFENNYIMSKTLPILEKVFRKENGKFINLINFKSDADLVSIFSKESNIFEIELLKEVGLFGTILFIGFVLIMGYFVYRYLRKTNDSEMVKAPLVIMILNFFIFESIYFTMSNAPHNDNAFSPFLRSSSLLVVLFVLGYTFIPFGEKEETHE